MQALVSLAHVVADFVLLYSVEASLEIEHAWRLLLPWPSLRFILARRIFFVLLGHLLNNYVETLKLISIVLGGVDLIAFVVDLSLDYFVFFED